MTNNELYDATKILIEHIDRYNIDMTDCRMLIPYAEGGAVLKAFEECGGSHMLFSLQGTATFSMYDISHYGYACGVMYNFLSDNYAINLNNVDIIVAAPPVEYLIPFVKKALKYAKKYVMAFFYEDYLEDVCKIRNPNAMVSIEYEEEGKYYWVRWNVE